MKRTILLLTVILSAVLMTACARQEEPVGGTEVQTATVAQPDPQPGELGTDAMTQTVELSDGRSENEGGVITSPDPGVRVGSPIPPPTATTTATTTTTQTQPPRNP